MIFNIKALFVTVVALASFAKGYISYEPYHSRELVDGDGFDLSTREYEDALDARSQIDAALSSLSTRALISELNERLERRADNANLSAPIRVMLKRCKTELAKSAGKKVNRERAKWLEDCIASLWQYEQSGPVANWEVEDTPPPSAGGAAARTGAKKSRAKKSGKK